METPDILLLDEPMNGLDNAGVREMRELFKSLRAQGSTNTVHAFGFQHTNAFFPIIP